MIAEARDNKGDLSENAEYDAAKEAQGLLEMRISELKDIIGSARMIDESKITTSEVRQYSIPRKNQKHQNRTNHVLPYCF